MHLFGHALLEKLVHPYKAICAHVLDMPVPKGLPLAQWDAWLATALSADAWARKPFIGLPVLGVPGWWPDNAKADFYADATVFRPAQLSAKHSAKHSPFVRNSPDPLC